MKSVSQPTSIHMLIFVEVIILLIHEVLLDLVLPDIDVRLNAHGEIDPFGNVAEYSERQK